MNVPKTFATLLLVASAVTADELIVPVDPGADLTQMTQSACAAPASPQCSAAVDFLTARAVAALAILADRRDPQAPELARLAVDSASPELRAAAAEALAIPFAAPEDTPYLAELADDPVPAVRAAALRSLSSSSDPRAQLIARRADAYGGSGRDDEPSTEPDPEPSATASGVQLPADAVFLHFASRPGEGQLTYSTADAAAKVLAGFAKKGKGPFTPEQFRQEIEASGRKLEEELGGGDDEESEEGDMPSPEQMAKMMAMAQKVMQEMNKNPNATPEQQSQAARHALGVSTLNADLADAYDDEQLFGDPKLFIVQLADGSDAAVAVYLDRAVGRTGITVHRTPKAGG